MGRLMLVFKLELPETQPTTATELCLVRKMALKPRGAPPRTQYLAAEKRTTHDELGPHNKLGDLWTWATSHTASRGKFVVIPAQIILQTVPMMPKWREQTHGWSVQTGVFQNSYLLDPRLRPPFTACQCGK